METIFVNLFVAIFKKIAGVLNFGQKKISHPTREQLISSRKNLAHLPFPLAWIGTSLLVKKIK
jgi:hypothetical protein